MPNWESRIGRRVRLRDLHALFAVVECGSMAKAAGQLAVSQAAVSQMIADLEDALGVRLLERSPRGVVATIYGNALLRRGKAAFDELRQGVQEIEFLADPTTGEVRIGCPESTLAAILPPIVRRFSSQYPRALLHVETLATPPAMPRLRDRSLDLVISRISTMLAELQATADLNVEILLKDELVIAAGAHSEWASRRKIDLAELADAQWILTPFGLANDVLEKAFQARGLAMKVSMMTFSVHVRVDMIATGPYVTAFPKSVVDLYGPRFSIKALPVELSAPLWPVVLVTLKNRLLSPPVERFIECAREVAKRPKAARR
jgi:DNA-binding transcriptional LysR family regulator